MESNVAVARCMGSLERFKSHKAKMRFKHHVIRWNSEVILVYLADVFAKILDERSIRKGSILSGHGHQIDAELDGLIKASSYIFPMSVLCQAHAIRRS